MFRVTALGRRLNHTSKFKEACNIYILTKAARPNQGNMRILSKEIKRTFKNELPSISYIHVSK